MGYLLMREAVNPVSNTKSLDIVRIMGILASNFACSSKLLYLMHSADKSVNSDIVFLVVFSIKQLSSSSHY